MAEGSPASGIVPDTANVAGRRGVNIACTRPALIEWVRNRPSRVRREASVCSGAFLLAEPGLLDGRRAVTHWHRRDEFAGRYPQVGLERAQIFLRDGVIWTSTGVTEGIDLALSVVEEDHGRALALAVARELVMVGKRPGGQSPYIAPLKLQAADDRFSDLNAWVSANLAGSLTLQTLADRAGMSRRSFARHYRQRTGRTPGEAVEIIRLERAQGLPETGTSVASFARGAGLAPPRRCGAYACEDWALGQRTGRSVSAGGQRAIGLQLLGVCPILCVGERHRHRFRTYKLVFHNAAEQIGGVVGMVELLGAGCGLDNGCDLCRVRC